MKRTTLLLLAAVLSLLTAQAADYYFTHTAKWKVMGENLVTNGDFSDYLTGWTNEQGGDIDIDIWGWEQAIGPNDENVLMSLAETGGDGKGLSRLCTLDDGYYVVVYYLKSEGQIVTSVTDGQQNYVDVYVNAGATIAKEEDAQQVAASEVLAGDDWTLVVNAVTIDGKNNLVFNCNRLATGTQLTGFGIYQVREVYDTRLAERHIAYIEQLLNDENLTADKEELRDALDGIVYPTLTDPAQCEDAAEMEGLLEEVDGLLNTFLDECGANLVGNTLTDWTTWGGTDYKGMTTRGTWTFEGGRWGFYPNAHFTQNNRSITLEREPGDGYLAQAGIQTGQTLTATMHSADGVMDALPAGKYFFSIEAQAVAAANRAAPYGSDHSVAISGSKMYVGETERTLTDTLSGYYWKTYYLIAEIEEGQQKRVGFDFPVLDGKVGGKFALRNPQVRQLGVSVDEAEFNRLKEAFLVQQYNLGLRLSTYPEELADYPWEKDSLARAIAHAQPVYDASLLIIDAEGNVLDRSMVTDEQTQLMLDEVNSLGRARNYVLSANAPIETLRNALANAVAALNNPANSGADATKRQSLEQAVADGQALMDGLTEENQGEAFTEAAERIQKVQEEFESTSATRANPTQIVIANADFSEFALNSNITANGEVKGWHWMIGDGMGRWEIRDNETLTQGHGATTWRGTTAGPNGKVTQYVDLEYEGLYEYRAKAYISEERINELVAAAQVIYDDEQTPIDTIYTPGIRLFFGENGAPDSITVSKCYMGVKDDGTYYERTSDGKQYPGMVYASYSVYFKKQGEAPVTVEFGLEAVNNSATAGANGFGFCENQILYVGNEEQYLTDTRTEVDATLDACKTMTTEYDSYWMAKLNRYMADAQQATTAKEMQNALHGMKEVASRMKGVKTAIETVKGHSGDAQEVMTGVYTLTGVKVGDTTQGLKPGIYVVNGKKLICK